MARSLNEPRSAHPGIVPVFARPSVVHEIEIAVREFRKRHRVLIRVGKLAAEDALDANSLIGRCNRRSENDRGAECDNSETVHTWFPEKADCEPGHGTIATLSLHRRTRAKRDCRTCCRAKPKRRLRSCRNDFLGTKTASILPVRSAETVAQGHLELSGSARRKSSSSRRFVA